MGGCRAGGCLNLCLALVGRLAQALFQIGRIAAFLVVIAHGLLPLFGAAVGGGGSVMGAAAQFGDFVGRQRAT